MSHPDAPSVAPRAFCAEVSSSCVDAISSLRDDGYPVSHTVFQESGTQFMRLACLVDRSEDVEHVWTAMKGHWLPTVDERGTKRAVITLWRNSLRPMEHPDAPTVAPRAFCANTTEDCFRDLRTLDMVGRRVRTIFTAVPIRRHVCLVETPGDEPYAWALMRKHWVPIPDQDFFDKNIATLEHINVFDKDVATLEHIIRTAGERSLHPLSYRDEE